MPGAVFSTVLVFAAEAMPATKTFLVTGATEGIGLATVEQLQRDGHAILVHGRNAEKVEKVVKAVCDKGGTAAGYTADLSSLAQVRTTPFAPGNLTRTTP
eukprot:1034569-Prymnesium_polylepis.1